MPQPGPRSPGDCEYGAWNPAFRDMTLFMAGGKGGDPGGEVRAVPGYAFAVHRVPSWQLDGVTVCIFSKLNVMHNV